MLGKQNNYVAAAYMRRQKHIKDRLINISSMEYKHRLKASPKHVLAICLRLQLYDITTNIHAPYKRRDKQGFSGVCKCIRVCRVKQNRYIDYRVTYNPLWGIKRAHKTTRQPSLG